MDCKCITRTCNVRLTLLQVIKFTIVIFSAYGLLLSALPKFASYTGLGYDWMPSGKSDMFWLVAASTLVILVYYNIGSQYQLSIRSDLVIFGITLLLCATTLNTTDLGIYALVMLPLLLMYNQFSDIQRVLLAPKKKNTSSN